MSRRVEMGSRWGRWTVLKKAAPAPRYGETGVRARVLVRCVCGHQQAVFVCDLQSGKTRGCKRGVCSARYDAAEQLRSDFRQMVDSMRAQLEAMLERYLVQD